MSATDRNSLALDLYKTSEAVGMRPWTDELLGRLLAFCAATGFLEWSVVPPVQDVLMVAAYRFGIEGGRVPDMALLHKWYYPPLADLHRQGAAAPWLQAIAERYKVPNWQKMEYTWAGENLPQQLRGGEKKICQEEQSNLIFPP